MIERRAAAELKAEGGKQPRLFGYAAVFESRSLDLGGFTEIVKPGAFTRTLAADDQIALVQHLPNLVLGRRGAGTLRLSEDSRGLAFEIDVPSTTAARDLLVSIERGDVRGASFAFTTAKGGDRWQVQGNNVTRELLDVNLAEITICAQPAYQETSVAQRSYRQRFTGFKLRALQRFLETV